MKHTLKVLAIAAAMAAGFVPTSETAAFAANGRITVNVHNANVADVINLVALQAGVNAVVDADVAANAKPISLNLVNVTLDQALRSIEAATGLEHAYSDGVLHVGEAADIFSHYPNQSRLQTESFPLSNGDAMDLANRITPVLPAGTIAFGDPRTNTLIVKGSPEGVSAVRDIITKVDQPRLNGTSFSSSAIPLNNMKASDALVVLRAELPPGGSNTYAASDSPNVVLASGSADFIATARVMLAAIDRPGAQVRFSVKVLDYSPQNDSSNFGVEFGGVNITGTAQAATGSTVWAFANKSVPINATLNALITQGRARELADSQLLAINNQKATLNIGEQYPIVFFNAQTGQNQVQFFNAGVNITVTPTIGADGNITCQTDTQYSQITSFVQNYPVTSDRHVVSMNRIASDQSLVIGGLFEDVDTTTIQKVPILGDIPILGGFFKNKATTHSKDDVVFVLTPHIITAADFEAAPPPAGTGVPHNLPTPPVYPGG